MTHSGHFGCSTDGVYFAQADAIALDDLLLHHLAIDQLEGLAGRAGVSLDARSTR